MKTINITIKSNWEKVFEDANLVLLNEYPNIARDEVWNFRPEFDGEVYNEIYQWYLIGSDSLAEHLIDILEPEIAEDIKFSETLQHYVLAVRHFGTPWAGVGVTVHFNVLPELENILRERYEDKEQ